MTGFKFTLTVPKVNENWWATSKTKLQQIVEEYNKESWSKQQDPVDNTRWDPRKPPTGSWPILRKSGRMQDSTKFTSSGKMLFEAKTAVNYGSFHQNGTSKMPRRRWLGIGGDVTDKMAKVIAKNIFKGKTRITIP